VCYEHFSQLKGDQVPKKKKKEFVGDEISYWQKKLGKVGFTKKSNS